MKSTEGDFILQSSMITAEGRYKQGQFILNKSGRIIFSVKDINSIEQLTESEAKNFIAKVGWGTAAFVALGTIFSGGLGLLGAGAALLTAGNEKKISCLITVSGDKQYIVTIPEKVYLEVRSRLL